MRPAAVRPRSDQIGELTRGLHLPLPEIEAIHVEIIAERLLHAFNDIRAKSPMTVASGSEAEVTALMESRLNTMIEEDPFWGQLVLCVARGKESLSFDGSHLEKRPDLSIYLSNRTRVFPLVVEAKVLDSATGRTETLYCDHGLRRFVDGEYGWGNREAFMIAYVRDNSSIDRTLNPFLARAMERVPPGYLVEELPKRASTVSFDLAYSRHGRAFVYTNQPPPAHQPGAITVWHLWLKVEEATGEAIPLQMRRDLVV
jgi:hypothetical protein